MELNHTNTTKQTLQTAMENEQHICLSDSDSTDSDTYKAIQYSSPARFISNSDSDDSTKSQTHESITTNTHTTVNRDSTKVESPARSSIPSDSHDFTQSEANKARNTTTAHGTINRDSTKVESLARSSVSSDSDEFTKSVTVKASKTNSATATVTAHPISNRDSARVSLPPARSSKSSYLDDFTKSETVKASNTNTTTVNGDSTKIYSPPVESPARSSISSDQISLPHESLALEDNINKHFAAPTRTPPEIPPVTEVPPVVKKCMKEEQPLALVKADLFVGDDTPSVKEGGDGRRKIRPPLRKAKMDDEMVKKAALGFRIFGFLFCLVSFSVLAADRNQGWALDSFERYMEFRYCMSMNVIGFVYSGAQAFDLAYQSATGKNIVQHHLRYIFDFTLDQVVTYLLISASSSAATRIDDWQSNWGKDKFPDMASASVAMSFLAFAALAFSSLISGYVLCNSRST